MLSFGDNNSNHACNLECVENLPPVHEFVGPVKIVLMDVPKSVYTKKQWMSALITFAEMLIGANVMTILFYTLSFKTALMMNLHIALCTIGFQLFMPAAILMHSPLHGPAAPLKQADRRLQHMFLQIFAMICSGVGGGLVIFLGPGTFAKKLSSIHCWAGLVASAFCGLAVIIGPGAHFFKGKIISRLAKTIHAASGISAFLVSSVCFCLGVYFSKTLKSWAPLPDIIYILIGFCGIYSSVVICTPIMRIFNKTL